MPFEFRGIRNCHAGNLIASDLDYDLPFVPVVMVISPITIGTAPGTLLPG
jgi:hypothetical protein